MKKSIVFIITLFLSLASHGQAQTNEDQRRDRDIKIAEGIISEIFGDEDSRGVALPGFQSRSVRGEYIPGYGVHFTVSSGSPSFVHIQNLSSNDEQIRVELKNGNSTGDTSYDTEKIKELINEYMTKYASLISGLSDDETVRVTYASNRNESVRWIFVNDDEDTERTNPGVSVWARVSDLNAFKNGQISEQELLNRMNSHKLDGEENYKDFNVFASVLETALNSTENKNLRVSRKPQMEYLPGLGVRYRIQVSARPSFILNDIHFLDGDFEFRMDSLRMNLDESLRLMEESLNPLILRLDSMFDFDMSDEEREELQKELSEQQRVIRIQQDSLRNSLRPSAPPSPSANADSVDVKPEADAIISELLSVIDNYGSTLTSLENDEMLMISVNWSSRSDDLPERTEIRIRKSDLMKGEDPDIEEIEHR